MDLVRCQPPALLRCRGWNSSLHAPSCGEGYSDPGSGCSACEHGFYPSLGICARCPPSSAQQYIVIAAFIACFAGVFAIILGLVGLVAYWHTGSFKWKWSLGRSREFVTWVAMTCQTLVQVTKRSVNAPPAVRSVYSVLVVLELDTGAVLHPACYSVYPFTTQVVEFVGSLTLTLSLCALMRFGRLSRASKSVDGSAAAGGSIVARKLAKLTPTLYHAVLSFLILLYPLICNSTLGLLYCRRNSSGALVWAQNPTFVCYEGAHLPAAVLAWLVLCTHVIGFPVVTLLYLHRRVKMSNVSVLSAGWETAWRAFVGVDFRRPQYFVFMHLNMCVVFLLSVLLVYWPHSSIGAEAGVFLVTLAVVAVPLVALVRTQPYTELRTWKLIAKCAALLATAAVAVANLVCSLHAHGMTPQSAAEAVSFVVIVVLALGAVVFVLHFGLFVWRMKGTSAHGAISKRSNLSRSSSEQPARQGVDALVANPLLAPAAIVAAMKAPVVDSKRNARCVEALHQLLCKLMTVKVLCRGCYCCVCSVAWMTKSSQQFSSFNDKFQRVSFQNKVSRGMRK